MKQNLLHYNLQLLTNIIYKQGRGLGLRALGQSLSRPFAFSKFWTYFTINLFGYDGLKMLITYILLIPNILSEKRSS